MTAAMDAPILVVDDADTTVRIARTVLTQLGFPQVDEASTAGAAVQKLRTRRYRAILVDRAARAQLQNAAMTDDRLRLAPMIALSDRDPQTMKQRLRAALSAI